MAQVLSPAMKQSNFWPLLLAAVTLLLAGFILTDWLPALRGPAPDTSEWHWPYVLRPLDRWWVPGLAAAAFWFIAYAWLRLPLTETRLRPECDLPQNWLQAAYTRYGPTCFGLLGLMGAGLLLQLALVYAHRPAVAAELVDRTLSNETNGYFLAAAAVEDMNQLLRDFPRLMPTFPSEHTRTHPPGLVLAQWLTIKANLPWFAQSVYPLRCTDLWLYAQPQATASALGIWAFLPPFAAALIVIPLYWLGQQLYNPAVARLAAIFAAALPALLIFAPTPDQIFAFLAALLWLLWLQAVSSRKASYAFLAGLLLSGTTFLSLGNGALALPLLLFAFWPINLKSLIVNLKWLSFFLAGLATIWLIYWLGWGVAPWELARIALQQHYELVTSHRRYDWWLVYNLVDLLLFAGPIVVVGFAAAFFTALRQLTTNQKGETARFIIALGILIMALNLSGSARGEVGRLWLFFMPLLAVVAAATWLPHTRPRLIMLLLASQLALILAIGLAWKPIEAIIVVAERPEIPQTTQTHELAVSFAEVIQLTGYDVDMAEARPGGVLKVALYWQADGPVTIPYTVFTHLVNDQGVLVAQKDNWPVNGLWPPTCWRRGKTIVDNYPISLPADLPSGDYTLWVGLYDAATGRRLLTTAGQDALELGDGWLIGP